MSTNYLIRDKRLFPNIEKAPDKRSIGKKYDYMPTMVSKIPEIPVGASVILTEPPVVKEDIICKVKYQTSEFIILWKDLVK